MKAAVSDILASRSHDEAGLSRLVGYSFAAHIVVVAAVALAPTGWFNTVAIEPELMVISLGGAVGPSTTGTTPISGRPVEQVVETPRPEPPKPPAASKPDEMPAPTTKPQPAKPTPTPPPSTAPPATVAKPPVAGAKVQQGTATADTGTTGTNTGLTITGGGGGGDAVDLNNFNREWVLKLKKAIEDVWQQNQGEAGRVELRFTILRDGRVQEDMPGVLSTTGSFTLQMASIRAVKSARLPALPADFSGDRLIIRLGFDYKR